jgi:4-amino-4-deoxy-L-arabinose transferase-like glycosyltransferase
MCLFALAAAFRLVVRGVDRSGPAFSAAAGVFAGAAAAASLLAAAAAPTLLVWTLLYNRAGSRWKKLGAFGIGAAVPFVPVLGLLFQGPRQTWFNLVQYHVLFRTLYWPETTRHDLEVLTSWIDSGQALVLGLLAVCGLVYVSRASRWPRPARGELYLCAWMAAALAVEAGIAHPTFARYFVLVTPFAAVLAATGLYAIVSRALGSDRPRWPALLVLSLLALGLGKSLYDGRERDSWSTYERLAKKVDEVTPRGAQLFADEPIYFLMRRTPPPGLEFSYSHKIDLPPAERALLHILTSAEVKREVQSGAFPTAYSCDDDDIEDYGLKRLYRQHAELENCTIFWGR